MKKLKYVMVAIIVVIAMLVFTNKVQAYTTQDIPTVKEITIESPQSGNYATGEKITFKVRFSESVVGVFNVNDTIKVNFSESNIAREISKGTVSEDTITYEYILKAEDKGTLTFSQYSATHKNTMNEEVRSSSIVGFGNEVIIKANVNTPSTGTETPSQGSDGNEENSTLIWTDFSNATYEWTGATETDHRSLELNIKNVNLSKEGHSYWVYISHNENDIPDITKIGDIGASAEWKLLSSSGKIGNSSINSYLETNGDIYIWIAEKQDRETKIVLTAKKVERLAQLTFTKRIIGYFSNDNVGGATNIFLYEPAISANSRKVKCKIGRVTDNTILKNIKNNSNNAMSELLKYAKATTPIAEETLNIGTNSDIVSSLNLVNGAYYYVYFELEDENGKYYPVEDVELYQASILGKSITLLNHTDRNFVYNITDDDGQKTDTKQPEDNTTATGKLPQTGINTVGIILVMGVAVVAAVVGAKKYKKYNIKY